MIVNSGGSAMPSRSSAAPLSEIQKEIIGRKLGL
jgi:hypothetical protein